MIPRRLIAVSVALSLVGLACSGSGASQTAATPTEVSATPGVLSASPTSDGGSTLSSVQPGSPEEVACSIPHEWLLRTWRGYRSDRSGEIQILPKEYSVVGSGLPHVGPWPYVQDVPVFWYGPGHIQARGAVDRPVTLADIVATQAKLLQFDRFQAPDGVPMKEAIVSGQKPPKLIITVIWDAAGMDVLNPWDDAWPYLKSLIPEGTWYTHATVGSSPSSSAQDHAIIGTGAFPNHHGIVGHRLRIGGRVVTPWGQGPQLLIVPALADVYDRAMGNRPIVAGMTTVSIHLGFIGHGSMWGGGDKDIATTREVFDAATLGEETFRWNLSPLLRQYFRFPAYLNSVTGLEQDAQELDAADGKVDGKWRTHSIAELLQGFETPARIPYQTRVLEAMIEREGFGEDEVPDLLFVNYKEIDHVSHIWSANSLEMRDAVVWQDRSLKELIEFLDEKVGAGEYVLLVTSDHGSMVSPELYGGFQISPGAVATGINEAFDHDGDDTWLVELIQPTQIMINMQELHENGATLAQISKWIMGLTKGETAGSGVEVPPDQADELVFQAAFPSSIMKTLPCLPEARA
ncbi:MAG: alkaline phosphatase family protein [Actinomycetota bacterium]